MSAEPGSEDPRTDDPRSDDPSRSMKVIGQVFRSFAKWVDPPLRQRGFAFSQLPVLATLGRAGRLSQAELARTAQVEQSSMAQLLNRMERDGLIRRESDPADGRSRLITLTAAATEQLPAAKALMVTATETALDGFSAKERAQLLQWLQRIEANLQRALAAQERE